MEFPHNTEADYRLPIDDIEPEESPADLVRDARVQCISILNKFAAYIDTALARPNVQVNEIAVTFYGLAYALGLNCCEGMSMTERAISLGYTRAAISKIAREVCTALDLEPSWMMKSDASVDIYRDARRNVVEKSTQ